VRLLAQLLVWMLRRNLRYLSNKFVWGRYIWFVCGVKPQFYFWDAVILARKVQTVWVDVVYHDISHNSAQAVLALIIVFVGPENWSFGLTFGVIVVGAALVLQVHARPYEVAAANRVEETSMIATILTWLVALHFFNDIPIDEPWKVELETAIISLIHAAYVAWRRDCSGSLLKCSQVHHPLDSGAAVSNVPGDADHHQQVVHALARTELLRVQDGHSPGNVKAKHPPPSVRPRGDK